MPIGPQHPGNHGLDALIWVFHSYFHRALQRRAKE